MGGWKWSTRTWQNAEKTSCQQNGGESILIICDNMFECPCHTFCHMALNKFCELLKFQYFDSIFSKLLNIFWCECGNLLFLYIHLCKSAQRHDQGQRAYFILSIIAIANTNLCLPLLPCHCIFTERECGKEHVYYGYYSSQFQRNWLKNRKPHNFKHNAISFG